MSVTDEDREKAAELLRGGYRQESIARGLAAEREKARAPFLALAARYDGLFGCGELVAGIRRAAEES